MQLHQQLQRSRQPSARLGVSRIRLQAPNEQSIFRTATTSQKDSCQRSRLDWIAQSRARAVRL
jgi:hypothetical protein